MVPLYMEFFLQSLEFIVIEEQKQSKGQHCEKHKNFDEKVLEQVKIAC